jgi:hypothetical protein
MAARVTNVLGMTEARGIEGAAVAGSTRIGALRSHSMLAFPVNNRKKQGERAQPGAFGFSVTCRKTTGNSAPLALIGPAWISFNKRTEQDENRKRAQPKLADSSSQEAWGVFAATAVLFKHDHQCSVLASHNTNTLRQPPGRLSQRGMPSRRRVTFSLHGVPSSGREDSHTYHSFGM